MKPCNIYHFVSYDVIAFDMIYGHGRSAAAASIGSWCGCGNTKSFPKICIRKVLFGITSLNRPIMISVYFDLFQLF